MFLFQSMKVVHNVNNYVCLLIKVKLKFKAF